jgi:hexosaminidase
MIPLAKTLSLGLIFFATCQALIAADLSLIPQPAKVESKSGQCRITSDTPIIANKAARATAEYLSDILADTLKIRLKVVDSRFAFPGKTEILLEVAPDAFSGDEGYDLTVEPSAIQITANTVAGVFYGVQTLRQLLPSSAAQNPDLAIPCVEIEDQPRFHWRGLMLDVSRHFYSVDEVKRFLDLMAFHKFNTFHWHLTDDQGWRIEIKKYPKLTEVGAWRDDGHGGKYGGFYSQDQIRDVIAYAAARHITIVPEIEMPGHSQAALAAYPEFSCTGGPFPVGNTWGINKDVYCAGKDRTFDFLQDALSEVIELFPGQIIHIGGDECPKDRWKVCPDCQARIKTEHLKDEHELQSYFIKRIDTFVTSKGKRIIGWDEILEGGLAPGAAVMSWHGAKPAVTAATAGHDVVLSPTSHCYFDYYQSRASGQPKAIGGFVPIEKVYSFNPMPADLSDEAKSHVLGGQANLWTEYIDSRNQLDYMAYPRTCALAEVLWSPPSDRSFNEFEGRLAEHLKRLDALGVHYFKEPTEPADSK